MLWGPQSSGSLPPLLSGLWAPQAEPQGCLAGQLTGWGGLDRIPMYLPRALMPGWKCRSVLGDTLCVYCQVFC